MDDDDRLWRAVGLFRIAALLYAVALFAVAQDGYRTPLGGWLVLAGLAAWTVLLSVTRLLRTPPVLVADVLVAVCAVLATAAFDDPDRIAAGAQTLPSIYPAACVLAWSVAAGRRGGLLAAVAVSLADLVEVGVISLGVAPGQPHRLSASTVNNIVLLVLVGLVVGYAVELSRTARRDLARAVALQAAGQERERLARDIHDSVLQVLTYVQRRGGQLGGEAAELGALAGDQEARLRALVTSGPPPSLAPLDDSGAQDLRAALSGLLRGGVTVTGPAEAVMLAPGVVAAVTGAVSAALDNVEQHAGPGAKAWVLVEEEPGVVTVTVRDDGVGIPEGRLAAAEAEGRLGVSASVRGRIAEVGGEVEVVSRPGQGTEVELRVPVPARAGRRPR